MLVKPLVRPIVRAIAGRPTASLGGGFAPTSLFAANEPGYLYDLDDLSTVFLDSAMTTPATVNGLVGAVMDKSKGLALGAEIVPNGTFDNATGWTVPAGWTVSGGVATASATSSSFIQSTAPSAANTWYKVEFDWTHVSGTLFVRVGAGAATTFTTSGRKVCYLLSSGAGGVEFYGGTVSGTLDNLTAKPISGNHAYQSTTGSKPILRGTPTGGNLASGASWTAGTGWSIAGDTATATTSSGTLSALAAEVGKHYRVTYTITRTAGSIQPTFGGRTGTARSASGTYVQYFDNAISTAALVFTGTGFSGTVTLNTIEAVDISADSVAAPYALQYDGVDDFLQTAAVNFTATDKVTVCHGVRKLSDATTGVVASLGDLGVTNGSFEFRAPWNAATANIGCGMRGNAGATSGATYTTFTAPITNVFSFQMDYALGANAEIVARANGSTLTAAGTDSGAGPFANAILYFGRRGGTSLPYNGLEFSSVCIGRLLTAAELANVERWVGRKTGISL